MAITWLWTNLAGKLENVYGGGGSHELGHEGKNLNHFKIELDMIKEGEGYIGLGL